MLRAGIRAPGVGTIYISCANAPRRAARGSQIKTFILTVSWKKLISWLYTYTQEEQKKEQKKKKKISCYPINRESPSERRAGGGSRNILLCVVTRALQSDQRPCLTLPSLTFSVLPEHGRTGVSRGIQIECTQAERIWLWANPISLFMFRLVILM